MPSGGFSPQLLPTRFDHLSRPAGMSSRRVPRVGAAGLRGRRIVRAGHRRYPHQIAVLDATDEPLGLNGRNCWNGV